MVELLWHDPDAAWVVTRELVQQASGGEELAYVAAGPLEELLRLHGARFAQEVITEARRDRKFRRALTGVWGWQNVHPPLVEAIRRLLDPP